MDRNDLNRKLCAVISTLAEVKSAPESILYLGIGGDMGEWDTVKSTLLKGGLMNIGAGSECFITPFGSAMAKKINAAMAQ